MRHSAIGKLQWRLSQYIEIVGWIISRVTCSYEHVTGKTLYPTLVAHCLLLHDYIPNNPNYVYRNRQDDAELLNISNIIFTGSSFLIYYSACKPSDQKLGAMFTWSVTCARICDILSSFFSSQHMWDDSGEFLQRWQISSPLDIRGFHFLELLQLFHKFVHFFCFS